MKLMERESGFAMPATTSCRSPAWIKIDGLKMIGNAHVVRQQGVVRDLPRANGGYPKQAAGFIMIELSRRPQRGQFGRSLRASLSNALEQRIWIEDTSHMAAEWTLTLSDTDIQSVQSGEQRMLWRQIKIDVAVFAYQRELPTQECY